MGGRLNQYWSIGLDAAYMGQKRLFLSANGAAILDSGYFAMSVQLDVLSMYHNQDLHLGITMKLVPLDPAQPALSVPLVPCAELGALPALTFLIGGVEHHLSAQQMALQDKDTMHA